MFVSLAPFAYLEGHGSTFRPRYLQAKTEQLVIETCRAPDRLPEDAMAGYIADCGNASMLDGTRVRF